MKLPTFESLVTNFPPLSSLRWPGARRSMPFIQQLSATECGAACLAMVLRYHGRSVNMEQLRDSAVSGRDGTNAQVLVDAAKSYGMTGQVVALDLDALGCLETGAILHWSFNHFVVFVKHSRTHVWIVDPARGHRKVALTQFSQEFTGVAILLEPMPWSQDTRAAEGPAWQYFRQILSESTLVRHVLVTSVLLQLFGLGVPLITRVVIDTVVPRQDYGLLIVLMIGAAFMIAFQAATTLARAQLLLSLRIRLDARMSLAFLDHLLSLPFAFFQRRTAGDLMVRVGTNATVREILTGTMLSTVLDGFLAVGYLSLLVVLNGAIAAVVLLLAALQVTLLVVTRVTQRQLVAESLETQGKSQGYLMEILSAIEVLKSLGVEQRAVERWSGLFTAELNISLRRGRVDAILETGASALRMISTTVLLASGASQVLSGRLTLGEMLAVIAVANGFISPVVSLASAATMLQLLGVYLERLNDVFDARRENDHRDNRVDSIGTVRLDNVSFRYSPIGPTVLRNITTTIRPGECIALVGRSGSGKSTLARLLVALYQPTEGSVLFDGINVEALDLRGLRRRMGIVTQQTQLFGTTIRANIALVEPTTSLEAVIRVAKLAAIHDDIAQMPMAYDTILADRGGALSGGQSQRVALARALLNDPDLLVLDEATSQLDTTTEQIIHQNLASIRCTRVIVAHRLSTIAIADRILVLDQGELVGDGTHDALYRTCPAYASLMRSQSYQHAS